MTKRFGITLKSAMVAAALMVQPVSALAHGEVGEHVEDLKGHLDEYEQEVTNFNEQTADMANRYEEEGAEAVNTDELIELWEDVKFHAALETNYVPVYASVWQGIYGVKDAIDNGKPAEEVHAAQQALAQAMWQGMGAVKLASRNQAAGDSGASTSEQGNGDPVEQILANLDQVTVEYAEGHAEEATELVHDTYMDLFEGIEGALIEQDAELVENLEKDFNVTLPQQLEEGASVSEVTEQVDAMKKKLGRASELLEKAEKDQGDVF